ncbi:PREDICTED: uncharacterized protein LOC104816811 isoform X1 [Tarenaya hassleriana]|uniref:uncharacterized protein LOC104816811 isoform X1 n=1 Tax=Tarenaya hassleriana TaxID=28532 RepID=UPI00053C4126|nr:PREDICTED: uncharacterized protein LOC104816811 isoform X1 [Tarenaya hassleriana]XP_010544085.1 PREDICTED: uncharacterized protein LOC104816811 isoform X1 [Tarenaya hassleriana]XP_010544086.1 PREDICTED: uncharacterized protein LOC104816811 isoform X1 [Tarenaya hassleriana]
MASFSDDPTTLSPGSSTPISSAPLTQSPTDPYANPLYLHTADSSSLILVSEKLVGDSNYNIWSRSVEKALLAKNKLGFVRGTIPKPSPNHPDAGSWDRCNALISTWITNVVSTEIASLIVYMGDAATVWTILETRFKQKNAAKIYNIQHRLDSLHQGSMDLNSYFTKMTSLWKELKNHEPFPVCTCGKCSCSLERRWLDLIERRNVVNFLMRLNESYNYARRQILMIDPLPDISRAFNLVSQEEQQRLTLPGNSDVVVFQTGPHFSSDKSRPILPTPPSAHYQPESRPIIFCSHCGLSGHLVSKCFKLHGYPANYRGPSSTPRQAYQSKNRNYGHDRKQNHVNFINNSTDNPVHASLSATSGKASLARTVLASPVNVSVSGFEQLSS